VETTLCSEAFAVAGLWSAFGTFASQGRQTNMAATRIIKPRIKI